MEASDPHASTSARLSAMPGELLERLVVLATLDTETDAYAKGSYAAIAGTCSGLRQAVHSTCTSLVLGGPTLTGSALPCPLLNCCARPSRRSLQSSSPHSQEPSPLDEDNTRLKASLLGLVARARHVTSLCLQPQASFLSLAEVMAAGGLPLAQRLVEVDLSGRDELTGQDLAPLAACTHSLRRLDLSHCGSLKDLSPISGCLGLRTLSLCECQQLENQDLAPLSDLTGLQSLSLCGCLLLDELTPLSRLTGLKDLSLARCWRLPHIEPLAWCKSLEHLNLDMSPNPGRLDDLSPLSALTELKTLNLRSISRFHDAAPLASCVALEELTLWGCNVADLQPLAALIKLRRLDLGCCRRIQQLAPLSTCIQLKYLCLRTVERITDLSPVAAMTALEFLDLTGSDVANLEPLAACKSLTHLDLSYSWKVQDLTPLQACPSLEFLGLAGCCAEAASTSPLAT